MWSTKCLTLSTILAVSPNWINFLENPSPLAFKGTEGGVIRWLKKQAVLLL